MAERDEQDFRRAQAHLLRSWNLTINRGSTRLGWKIGINDPRAQRFYGIEDSVVGYMNGDSLLESGREFPRDSMLVVEPELAIRIVDDFDVERACEPGADCIGEVCPALELLDLEQPRQTLKDVMSHNIFHVGVAMGRGFHPQLAASTFVEVAKGGESVASARALQALPPLDGIVRLVANTLASHGEALQGGDVIISGSITAQIPLEPGHSLSAKFSGLGWLNLDRDLDGHVRFTESPWIE